MGHNIHFTNFTFSGCAIRIHEASYRPRGLEDIPSLLYTSNEIKTKNASFKSAPTRFQFWIEAPEGCTGKSKQHTGKLRPCILFVAFPPLVPCVRWNPTVPLPEQECSAPGFCYVHPDFLRRISTQRQIRFFLYLLLHFGEMDHSSSSRSQRSKQCEGECFLNDVTEKFQQAKDMRWFEENETTIVEDLLAPEPIKKRDGTTTTGNDTLVHQLARKIQVKSEETSSAANEETRANISPVQQKQLEIMDWILERSAEVNLRNAGGLTPLNIIFERFERLPPKDSMGDKVIDLFVDRGAIAEENTTYDIKRIAEQAAERATPPDIRNVSIQTDLHMEILKKCARFSSSSSQSEEENYKKLCNFCRMLSQQLECTLSALFILRSGLLRPEQTIGERLAQATLSILPFPFASDLLGGILGGLSEIRKQKCVEKVASRFGNQTEITQCVADFAVHVTCFLRGEILSKKPRELTLIEKLTELFEFTVNAVATVGQTIPERNHPKGWDFLVSDLSQKFLKFVGLEDSCESFGAPAEIDTSLARRAVARILPLWNHPAVDLNTLCQLPVDKTKLVPMVQQLAFVNRVLQENTETLMSLLHDWNFLSASSVWESTEDSMFRIVCFRCCSTVVVAVAVKHGILSESLRQLCNRSTKVYLSSGNYNHAVEEVEANHWIVTLSEHLWNKCKLAECTDATVTKHGTQEQVIGLKKLLEKESSRCDHNKSDSGNEISFFRLTGFGIGGTIVSSVWSKFKVDLSYAWQSDVYTFGSPPWICCSAVGDREPLRGVSSLEKVHQNFHNFVIPGDDRLSVFPGCWNLGRTFEILENKSLPDSCLERDTCSRSSRLVERYRYREVTSVSTISRYFRKVAWYLFGSSCSLDKYISALDVIKEVEECKAMSRKEGLVRTCSFRRHEHSLLGACERGDFDRIERLIREGVSNVVDIPDNDGKTPLHAACWGERVDVVKYLIGTAETNTVNTPDQDGQTPLWLACEKGNLDILRYLIEEVQGAEVATPDTDGWTPLFVACFHGHVDVVKFLIESANKNTVDTPEYRDGETPLHAACWKGHVDIINYLVRKGKTKAVDTRDKEGWTPLYMACDRGRLGIVKYLIETAETTAVDTPTAVLGWTPLYVACKKGYLHIVEYLIQKAQPKTVDTPENDGRTPLYAACREGHLEIVKLLIKVAETTAVDTPDADGWTPLYVAALMNNWQIMDTLIVDGGASIVNAVVQRQRCGRPAFINFASRFVKDFNEPEFRKSVHEYRSDYDVLMNRLMVDSYGQGKDIRRWDWVPPEWKMTEKELRCNAIFYNNMESAVRLLQEGSTFDPEELERDKSFTITIMKRVWKDRSLGNVTRKRMFASLGQLLRNVLNPKKHVVGFSPNLVLIRLGVLYIRLLNDVELTCIDQEVTNLLETLLNLDMYYFGKHLLSLILERIQCQEGVPSTNILPNSSEARRLRSKVRITAQTFVSSEICEDLACLALFCLDSHDILAQDFAINASTTTTFREILYLRSYSRSPKNEPEGILRKLRRISTEGEERVLSVLFDTKASCHFQLGHIEDAEKEYQEALRKTPACIESQVGLGNVMFHNRANEEQIWKRNGQTNSRIEDIRKQLQEVEDITPRMDTKYVRQFFDRVEMRLHPIPDRNSMSTEANQEKLKQVLNDSLVAVRSLPDLCNELRQWLLDHSGSRQSWWESMLGKPDIYIVLNGLSTDLLEGQGILKVGEGRDLTTGNLSEELTPNLDYFKCLKETMSKVQKLEMRFEDGDIGRTLKEIHNYYKWYLNQFIHAHQWWYHRLPPYKSVRTMNELIERRQPTSKTEAFRLRDENENEFHLNQKALDVVNNEQQGRSNRYGKHVVSSIGGLHLKRKPHAPGVEQAVYLADRALADITRHDHAIAPSKPIKIICHPYTRTCADSSDTTVPHIFLEKEEGYTVFYLASLSMGHYNLRTVLEERIELLEKLDMENFSFLCILFMLTNPGDAKPDNFVVELYAPEGGLIDQVEQIRLVSVDNDVAFSKSLLQSHQKRRKGGNYADILNVLYFFPHMERPVPDAVKERLLDSSQLGDDVVVDWLYSLHKVDLQYRKCWANDLNELKLPIELPKGTAIHVYDNLKQIRDIFKHRCDVTLQDIFKQLYPQLSEFYRFQRHGTNVNKSIVSMYQAAAETEELAKALGEGSREESYVAWSQISGSRNLSQGEHRQIFNSSVYDEMVSLFKCRLKQSLDEGKLSNNVQSILEELNIVFQNQQHHCEFKDRSTVSLNSDHDDNDNDLFTSRDRPNKVSELIRPWFFQNLSPIEDDHENYGKVLSILLRYELEINKPIDERKGTILHHITRNWENHNKGQNEDKFWVFLACLLQCGVDVDWKDDDQLTAAELAWKANNYPLHIFLTKRQYEPTYMWYLLKTYDDESKCSNPSRLRNKLGYLLSNLSCEALRRLVPWEPCSASNVGTTPLGVILASDDKYRYFLWTLLQNRRDFDWLLFDHLDDDSRNILEQVIKNYEMEEKEGEDQLIGELMKHRQSMGLIVSVGSMNDAFRREKWAMLSALLNNNPGGPTFQIDEVAKGASKERQNSLQIIQGVAGAFVLRSEDIRGVLKLDKRRNKGTVLHGLAANGSLKGLELLSEKCGDKFVYDSCFHQNEHGKTALHVASQCGQVDFFVELANKLKAEDPQFSLYEDGVCVYASTGPRQISAVLKELGFGEITAREAVCGVYLERVNKYGNTPLFEAVKQYSKIKLQGHPDEMVKHAFKNIRKLFNAGADCHFTERNDKLSPVHLIFRLGIDQLADELFDSGLGICLRQFDRFERGPIDVAVLEVNGGGHWPVLVKRVLTQCHKNEPMVFFDTCIRKQARTIEYIKSQNLWTVEPQQAGTTIQVNLSTLEDQLEDYDVQNDNQDSTYFGTLSKTEVLEKVLEKDDFPGLWLYFEKYLKGTFEFETSVGACLGTPCLSMTTKLLLVDMLESRSGYVFRNPSKSFLSLVACVQEREVVRQIINAIRRVNGHPLPDGSLKAMASKAVGIPNYPVASQILYYVDSSYICIVNQNSEMTARETEILLSYCIKNDSNK